MSHKFTRLVGKHLPNIHGSSYLEIQLKPGSVDSFWNPIFKVTPIISLCNILVPVFFSFSTLEQALRSLRSMNESHNVQELILLRLNCGFPPSSWHDLSVLFCSILKRNPIQLSMFLPQNDETCFALI